MQWKMLAPLIPAVAALAACSAPNQPTLSHVPVPTLVEGLPEGYAGCIRYASRRRSDEEAFLSECRSYLTAYVSRRRGLTHVEQLEMVRAFEQRGLQIAGATQSPTSTSTRSTPNPSEGEKARAERWAKCTVDSVRALDDGRSDAATIATAVVGRCRSLFGGVQGEDMGLTIEVVLRLRAPQPDPAIGPVQPMPRGDLRF